MEFLSLSDSNYSDGKKGQSTDDKINIVLSVVDRGLEIKEQTKVNDFVGGLNKSHSKYFKSVMASKPTDQEKAIISALLNKYPKLFSNESAQTEFRQHLENMLKEDKLEKGSLKYLVERLVEKRDSKADKKKKEPEAPEGEAPEGEVAQTEEGQEGGVPEIDGAVAQDTENSATGEVDFYSAWENEFNDTDTDLSEDQFNDMIDSDELDGILSDSVYSNLAERFLIEKLKDQQEDTSYSSLMVAEDFIVERMYSESILTGIKTHREALGFLAGVVTSLTEGIASQVVKSKLTTQIKILERDLDNELSPTEKLKVQTFFKEVESYDTVKSIEKKWRTVKEDVKSKEAKTRIELLVRLYVERGKGKVSFMKAVTKAVGKGFQYGILANASRYII